MTTFGLLLVVVAAANEAAVQSEEALRKAFEGKRVTVKMDMPGTADGVDIAVGSPHPIDLHVYNQRLRANGTAIKTGEVVTVTKVKVKERLIEFHLGGGGYGTFFDDTGTSTYVSPTSKSAREKELERKIRSEPDARTKRDLERELAHLRRERERLDRQRREVAAAADEAKRVRIQQARLQGGSRFNLRYAGGVPPELTPEDVTSALAEYIDFSETTPVHFPPRENAGAAPDPASGSLQKGMTRTEVEARLGKPDRISERMEGGLRIVTLVFTRADRRIEAELVEDVLIRYVISSR